MGAKVVRSALYSIIGGVVIWHCPMCQQDQWAKWEKKCPHEEKLTNLEKILANPFCVGCETILTGAPRS